MTQKTTGGGARDGPAMNLDPPVNPPAWAIFLKHRCGWLCFVPLFDPSYLGTREHSKHHKVKNRMAGWRHGGKSRQAKSEGATGHPIRASARTKDDVCDDDKIAVMQAPTCESSTLKRVGQNAIKTELKRAATQLL